MGLVRCTNNLTTPRFIISGLYHPVFTNAANSGPLIGVDE